MPRVLVTGATGFIGRVVAEQLVADGVQVRALVRGAGASERLAKAVSRDVECVTGDLLEPASLARAVEGCDAVAHLAARVDPSSWTDEATGIRETREAAIDIARAARNAGCSRFVFISSIAAMGFRSGISTPADRCEPVSAYGRAKLEAERGILGMAARDFDVIVLRPPTVYGPGERYNFLSFVRAVHRGMFRVIGSGENVMPLCTSDNIGRATREALLGRVPRGVHLVADDAWYSMNRIHHAICRALGRRPPRFRIPLPVANLLAVGNELAAKAGAPLVLHRSRVRTLTVDQRFDLSSLGDARKVLDAPLEAATLATVDDYRAAGVLDG